MTAGRRQPPGGVAIARAAAARLAHAVGTRAAWLLAPMASTGLYMLCAAAKLRFIERMYRRRRK